MKKLLSLVPTLASALALSACVVGPDYVKPSTPASTPDTAAFAEAARTSAISAAALPANWWQCAETQGAFTLVGCTVAPGFVFSSFEMAPPDWTPGVAKEG